ncbi:MAG: DNA internalization-related competence protein ComEC/Rec2 [Neisseria sp.]|nr:DNA internalization-related competence protein ComEC/Rec2 [Neisseria sp.]
MISRLRIAPWWCGGAVLSFALPVAPPWWLMAMMAAVLLAWAYVWHAKPYGGLCLLLAALAAGGAYAVWRTDLALEHRLAAADTGRVQSITIQVNGLPEKFPWATRFSAKVLSDNVNVHTIMLSDYRHRTWEPGSVWQITTRLNAPIGTVNTAGFNREAWALAGGIDAFGSVHKERRQIFSNTVSGSLLSAWRMAAAQRIARVGADAPHGAALVAALTVGVRADVRPEDWEAFRRLGLTHLISISGLHVGMAGLFAAGLAALLLRLWARVACLPLPQHPKMLYAMIGVSAAISYALLAGFSVPTQRSVVMLAVAAGALLARRYFTAWQIWWYALTAVLLFDPLAVLTVGFWLSFGLVAALLFFSSSRLRLQASGKLRLFAETQYAATLASVVPLGVMFAALPVLSPLANILAIPWFSMVLTPLALLSLLCPWDGLLRLTIWLCTHTLDMMQSLTAFAPMHPVTRAPWWWMLLAMGATAVWLLPRGLGLRLWAAAVLCGFVFFPAPRLPENTLRATVYDVGQGLSVVLQTRQHTLLFDSGKSGANLSLLPALYADGIHRLDALVLSHNDNDHDGARDEIRAGLPVRHIWAGKPDAYAFPTTHCTDDMAWTWDGVWFEWLTPRLPEHAVDSNEQSCVLRVLAGKNALLITGDLGTDGESTLVEHYGDALYSQVLVLGHHGSLTSSSPRFLNTVAPQYAIVSAGFGNSFSHPHPRIIERLHARQIKVRRTDWQGAIQLELSQEIQISPTVSYRPYWQQKPFD